MRHDDQGEEGIGDTLRRVADAFGWTDEEIAAALAAPPAVIETPTRALREKAPKLLRDGVLRDLVEGEDEWLKDWRDLLVVLAPYHDCARRLGLDVAVLFEEVAEQTPEPLRGLVRRFGARTDVTPGAFGFCVLETPDGPQYSRI